MAYAGKYFDKSDYRVYCVLGDGKFSNFFFEKQKFCFV
jgi:transketolase N-terminal domain/subunit